MPPRVKKLRSLGFRAGSSLLAESDTQALVGELDGKVEHRAQYAQAVDAAEVRDKRGIEDLSDATDFDELKRAAWTFNPGVDYYHGWSEGNDIVLLRRDPATGRRIKEVHPFEWYFYVTREDYERLPRDAWDWLCRRFARRVVPDENFPDKYFRVYVENPVKKLDRKRIFAGIGDPQWGANWAFPFYRGERPQSLRPPQDRDKWTKLHEVVTWCQRKGVTPLEADLSPKQRFLTDFDLTITPKFRLGFFDLETDDSVGGFDNKEQCRILSIAWEGDRAENDPDDQGFLFLREESDEAEAELLRAFKRECVDKYDVLCAWNGTGFDFPVLFARYHYHGIFVDWRYNLFADPLPLFKRHYVRAGGDAISYSLDAIGEKVLKMRKLDWRPIFRERHPGVVPKFVELYRHDPELLEEYNRYDATILRKLEAFTGFVAIEQIFCRIANGFPNDFNISTKVDQLLLKKGFKEGHHFPTRYWIPTLPGQYEGAYVFPPVVGMHRNVAAFDFKSLYPSMISSFNISPETVVKEADRGKFDPRDLCRIPFVEVGTEGGGTVRKGGSTFRIDRQGYLSQMFARTLMRRKKYTDLQQKRLAAVGTTQDDLFLLYYRLAYSFKRLGLSFYGDIGNPRSRYYDPEVAEAITLSGQFFIKKTEEYANENGLKVLYGDTDSVYVQLSPENTVWDSEEARIAELNRIGEAFVAYCQERYVKLLEAHGCNLAWNIVLLEFEDIYDRIFFLKKKRYAGRMLSHKGGKTDHVEVKGLEVMRSDCSGRTRTLQQRVLDAVLLEGLSAERVEREVIAPAFDECVSGRLSADAVTIGKGISKEPDDYKTTSLHVKLAAGIRETGREFFVGMKVEYVVTAVKPTLSGVTREEYDEAAGAISYAAEYYWDRVIFPASLRILEVCYPDWEWSAWLVEHRERRRKLVERYRRWLADPKRAAKAVERIRVDSRGITPKLTAEDLEELRRAPRAKRIRDRKGTGG